MLCFTLFHWNTRKCWLYFVNIYICLLCCEELPRTTATDRTVEPKDPGQKSTSSHRNLEEAGSSNAAQRHCHSCGVSAILSTWLDVLRRKSPSPRLPGITSCPVVFVATCKVYFLSNCKQTIAKISIESVRLRESPAGTEAYGWIIYDDFVVLLLLIEVCVCVCDMYLWFQLGIRPPGKTGHRARPERDQGEKTHWCYFIPDDSTWTSNLSSNQKRFQPVSAWKKQIGHFFSSDNGGKQLLPSWRKNIW